MRLCNKLFHGINFIFTDTFSVVAAILVGYAHPHQVELDHTVRFQLVLSADAFVIIDIGHKAQQIADLAGGYGRAAAYQGAHNALGLVHIILRHLSRYGLRRERLLRVFAAAAVVILFCHLCRHPFCSDTHKCRSR